MPAHLLGIDVGTQSSKGVLVTTDGEVVAAAALEHAVESRVSGWAEHDADAVWWGDFVGITRSLLDSSGVAPGSIAAIGVSALTPNMLPLDATGHPVRSAILYNDTRASAELSWLRRELGWDRPEVVAMPKFSSHSVAPKILWFREHEPERWERTRKIISATGYLVHRLTGACVVDPRWARAVTPFYDAQREAWDSAACQRFGVCIDCMPDVRRPAEVVAGVSAEAARETGLAEGTPVICGGGDAPAEFLSTGAIEPGEGSVLYGSTMCVSVLSSAPCEDPRIGYGSSHVPGMHSVGGGMVTSGALTRWFRDNFGQAELDAERRLGVSAYHLLGDEAARVPPGAEGLVVLPYFSGERSPIQDAEARGLVLGLTVYHTRRHVYRALLEATAYGLRQHFELMAEAGVRPKRLVAAGGGSQSELWTQIVSDVTGFTQECVERPIGPALGDAFLGGYGVGLFRDFQPLRDSWVRMGRTVQPNPAAVAIYDRYYPIYSRLYERNRDEMHELSRLAAEQHA